MTKRREVVLDGRNIEQVYLDETTEFRASMLVVLLARREGKTRAMERRRKELAKQG